MYQAFARKYRPQTWADVVGQEHVTVTLANALRDNRLHHAYLFCGARGVGKTTVARILAKAVNCTERGKTPEPCNQCESCSEVTEGRSLDVQEIDGASNTSVEDVREIREKIKYLPTGERNKIYIIDEVHMLSKAAFNALLKTLEEPPPHVLFFFATTEPHKIPTTILSRCQRYDFRRVGAQDIVKSLAQIANREKVTVSDDVLYLLAYEAEGGLRDAQSLFDQAIAFCEKDIAIDRVRQLLGLTDRTTILQMVEAICARDAKTVLQCMDTLFQSGGNLQRIAQELLEFFRHLWVVKSCGDFPNPADTSSDSVEAIKRLADGASLEEFQQWFAILFRGIDDIIRGRFPKLAMESLLLQMVQVGPVESIGDLIDRVESLSSGIGMTPAPAPKKQTQVQKRATSSSAPTPVTRTPAASATEVRSVSWETFEKTIKAKKPQLASILAHGTVQKADASSIEIAFPPQSIYADMLRETDRAEQFKQLVHQQFGASCIVKIIHGDGLSTVETREVQRKATDVEFRKRHEGAIENDLVKEAGALFGAEIKDVKVLKKV